jgi:hypothetical protein
MKKIQEELQPILIHVLLVKFYLKLIERKKNIKQLLVCFFGDKHKKRVNVLLDLVAGGVDRHAQILHPKITPFQDEC